MSWLRRDAPGAKAETGGVAIGGDASGATITVGAPQEDIDSIRTAQARQEAMLAELLRRGDAETARAAGVSEAAIIELARRVAADVTDLDQAMRELSRAVEVAVRVQAEGAQGSNLGGFVDAVLARVAALSGAGDFDGAAAAAEGAFARWEREEAERRAAAQAQGLRLLEAGLAQDLLRRDAAAAAAKIAKRVEIETPEAAARFAALDAAHGAWFARGRDRGLALDLAVSIDLARRMIEAAGNADERGAAWNALGLSLTALGAREAGAARLEAAVEAFRTARKEWRRDAFPGRWAGAEANLGVALQDLGRRDADAARLEQSVTAIRAALGAAGDWVRRARAREARPQLGAEAAGGGGVRARGSRPRIEAGAARDGGDAARG